MVAGPGLGEVKPRGASVSQQSRFQGVCHVKRVGAGTKNRELGVLVEVSRHGRRQLKA